CPPMIGTVVDNHDPEGLGRIRVSHEGTMPGSVSPWLPVAGHSRGNGRGFWTLPSTGTQALVAYTSGDRRSGYVLGFIYDGQHKPPEATGGKASGSILVQTKNHRIEITDSEGSGEVRIESAEGQMRAVIGSEGGITLANELGGIGIKCRRLAMDCGGETILKSRSISIETEDKSEVRAGGKSTMEADGDATLKGKNIRLSGSKGVCAEGKQIAVQDDQVMGFDTHMMVVPSGSGTATVPLPHPFMGKMSGDLSEDVKIGGKGCAVKGSKAKHNDSSHMQLPGTIKFQSKPKCEGEVTGGTSAKVKIDGKEAAVIGSQVTTCNDMGARNNSTIMAVGSAIPMPAIINPQNAGEYRREREEKEKRDPSFQNVRWSKTCVDEGEEVELNAGVKDIADGNMVTLQVFHEGQGPGDGRALASIPLSVKDGAVSARWSWKSDAREMPPEADPRFIFTAHCAWCNFEKSSNSLEVKLKRPEITKVEWQDKDGNSTSKGLVGETLKLHAETKNMEGGVTFNIFDSSTKKQVASIGAPIEGDKAEAEWSTIDNRLPDNTSPLKYAVEATANRCKSVESGECQIKNPKVLSMKWDKKAIYYGSKTTLKIKTFELSDESPTCKLQLWEKDYTTEDDFILEQDITISNDEVEQEIEFNFDVDKVLDEDESMLEVFCRLIYNGKDLAVRENSTIHIHPTGDRR
ncbi:MAG: phage baseplate assembly protein V, partial [Spirochaetales bacterium]|nr:phage baseplate assembly protein V [Spirochaetales bacterium]